MCDAPLVADSPNTNESIVSGMCKLVKVHSAEPDYDRNAFVDEVIKSMGGHCHLPLIESQEFTDYCKEYFTIDSQWITDKSYMTYVTALISLILYEGKYPRDIWTDYDQIRSVQYFSAFNNGCTLLLNEVPITDAQRKRIKKKIGFNETKLIEKYFDYNATIGFSNMPLPIASAVSKILLYPEFGDIDILCKSLWKPYKRDDIVYDIEPTEVVDACYGASFAGPKHMREKQCSEDCCGAITYNGTLTFFEADGISESSNGDQKSSSAIGSRLAGEAFMEITKELTEKFSDSSEMTLDFINDYFNKTFCEQMYQTWKTKIEANYADMELIRFNTTFTGVYRTKAWTVIVKIGDGSTIVQGSNGKSLITISDGYDGKGNYDASSLARSIYSPEHWNIIILPSNQITAVLLCSDGADDYLNSRRENDFGVVVGRDWFEHAKYETLMDELYMLPKQDMENYIDSMISALIMNPPFTGRCNKDDDVTVVYARFDHHGEI